MSQAQWANLLLGGLWAAYVVRELAHRDTLAAGGSWGPTGAEGEGYGDDDGWFHPVDRSGPPWAAGFSTGGRWWPRSARCRASPIGRCRGA